MRVIVTGASGFVGINLCQYLEKEGFDILKLDSKNINTLFTISEQSEQVFGIIHLAGKAHDLKYTSNPDVYYEVNERLTKDVFDFFEQSNMSFFIYLSSVKAVADSIQTGKLTEDTFPNPQTHYGKSKLKAERYIAAKMRATSKRVFILRPCMIHGPGNKGNLNLLYNIVKIGIPYPLGAFENQRSFLSIENLCFIISELIKNNKVLGGIYNVADSESISTNSLVNIMADCLGKKTNIWNINKAFIRCMAYIGTIVPLFPLNKERLDKLTENFEVSNDKIINAMGKTLPYSAEWGLKLTFKSFMKP